ncbi:MAG TPA: FG-GAP-like repeat-containing protein [Puia sp.]|nr:FG-GAP-like repeat-containing protein [Puia sp.]
MRITLHSLSGKRLPAYLAKLILSCSIIFFLLLFILKNTYQSGPYSIKVQQPKQDFTSVINKMSDLKGVSKRSRSFNSPIDKIDTNQLRQSDWFKTVKKDIERRSYFMTAGKKEKTFSSINNAQNLKADYFAEKFVLEPIATANDKRHSINKNNWQLNISFQGIYADGKKLQNSDPGLISGTTSFNDIEYNFNNVYSVQYHNDAKGVRQNFVIQKKPVGITRTLSISLKLEGDWVVNKVHDKELHFAKLNNTGGLNNKIVYNDLEAWDADGKPLLAKMEVKDNNNFEIIADVEKATYPVTIDPLSTSPSTTLSVAGGTFGNSVSSAGDVNGDGYTDVIVGSAAAHSAYVYLGSASGLSSSAATTISVGSGNFGTSVAGAGDVNGDGYGDIIVGEPGTLSGNAYVYLGSSSGLGASPSPSITLSGTGPFGVSVASAGDVDGDGLSDIIIGNAFGTANVYSHYSSGAFTVIKTLVGTGTYFGSSVAGAGDVNADGYSDVIVGNASGNVFVYEGSASGVSTTAAVTLAEPGAGPNYGFSVANAADVNGDGYSDIIVGDNGGHVYIYEGQSASPGLSSTAATTLTGTGNFGISVSGAGDVNGDGFADVIVGDENGKTFVFNGSASGIASGTSATATTALTGSGKFGFSVASVGDVNGDGYSDVIVGAYDISMAYIYIGGPDGSPSTNTLTIHGANAGDRFGLSVSSAGDVNGDGYSDVVVGAIGYNAGTLDGAIYLYMGSSTGLSTSSTVMTVSGGSESGWSVAAGDINGDGYSDIAVGAKFASTDAGSVYIYYGNSSGISNPSYPTVLNGGGAGYFFGFSVAVADVNADGYSDVIVGAPGVNSLAGAVYIYNGSSTFSSSATLTATLNGTNAYDQLGYSVSAAGDVNGDGYTDLVVGAPASYNYPTLANSLGYANVYKGGKTGIADNASADYVLSDANTNVVDFGINVAGAGDINGDGYGDVIVGASSADNNSKSGAVEIFLGKNTGLNSSATTVLTAPVPAAEDQFGASVASAGDVNGDGYSDIVIRATQPIVNQAATYIYTGSPSGISSLPATTFNDAQYNTNYEIGGSSSLNGVVAHNAVASAGDVNGDGYSDVIVGVYTDDNGLGPSGTKTGLAYIYYGNNSLGHNASNAFKLYETDLTSPIAADNLTQPQFGGGLIFQSPFARVKGRLVWETQPNGTGFQGSPITNNVNTSGVQVSYSDIPAGGMELKNLITKANSLATKVRVRIQYASTAVTFGQVYSPWVYSQSYLLGNNAGVLPLDLLSFTATPVNRNIELNWKASGEDDLEKYIVEHSLDAAKFDSIGYVTAKAMAATSSYDFTHYNLSAGTHYYRLKEVDKNGKISYSKTVFAAIFGPGSEFNIYPNPATDHITIVHTGIVSRYVRIINAAGAVMGQYQLNKNADQTTISLSGYAKGNYFVEIVNSAFAPKQITVY